MKRFEEVLAIIPKGRKNAVSMRTLSKKLGLSERNVRKEVSIARAAGNIVCGDNAGYYIPETAGDIERQLRRVQARQRTTAITAAAMRRALRDREGVDNAKTVC